MKRALIISVVIASFAAGVATCLVFTIYRARNQTVPVPAQANVSYRCPSARDVIATGRYVVVTIPNDREFYIGKNNVTLADIPNHVRQQIGDLPVEQRTVFVKGEPGVRYDTLSAVMRTIRNADVDRIEVVPITKKPLE